mgnify:CR=1 FL=1
MRKQRGFSLGELLVALIYIFGIIGWIMNIVQVVRTMNDPLTGYFVLKCVGILAAPLGAILGWIG